MKGISFTGVTLLALFNFISFTLIDNFTPISRVLSLGAIDLAIVLVFFIVPMILNSGSPYKHACNLVGYLYIAVTLAFGIVFMVWPPASHTWPLIIQVVILAIYILIVQAFIKAYRNAK